MLGLWASEGLGPSLASKSGLAFFGRGASSACSHQDTLVAKKSMGSIQNPPAIFKVLLLFVNWGKFLKETQFTKNFQIPLSGVQSKLYESFVQQITC